MIHKVGKIFVGTKGVRIAEVHLHQIRSKMTFVLYHDISIEALQAGEGLKEFLLNDCDPVRDSPDW